LSELTLGIYAGSRKENELRLPFHPSHFERIQSRLGRRIYLEEGYASWFDTSQDELAAHVAGFQTRRELIESCDVILLPKPLEEDLAELREGQVLWGWPHCVQQEGITQTAIDRRLTLIAWEAMNHWHKDGSFGLHVFHKNNEMAGYCSVIQALQLRGMTGEYGPKLRAVVIGFGATGRGAVSALNALGVLDVAVLTSRDPAGVESPIHSVDLIQYERGEDGKILVQAPEGEVEVAEFLADFDVIVNCVLQDPDDPLMFLEDDNVKAMEAGTIVVDVSCDEGMGFSWARPTSFEEPMFTVQDRIHYYAVDHSPSYMWNSATWEIGEALLPHLSTVMAGPEKWDEDETIKRAIEIRDGRIQNEKILSFQNREPEYPHKKKG
jgi:alanine dehydrogenase